MNEGVRIDDIFTTVGVFGRWQILQLTSLILNVLHIGHVSYFIVNIGYTPPHRCMIPPQYNDTLVHQGSCSLLNVTSDKNVSCLYGYEYNIYLKDSCIVSKWDLVCDRDYLSQLSQSIYIAGQFIGGYLFTFVSDQRGRKPAYLTSMFTMAAIQILMSFSPNIAVFTAGRFIVGICMIGMASSIYVLAVELLPQNKSHISATLDSAMFTVGVCITPLAGFVFQDFPWYCTTLLYGGLSIVNIHQIWVIDESIRWLLAKGQNKTATVILHKAAKLNRTQLKEIENLNNLLRDEIVNTSPVTKESLANKEETTLWFINILKHPRLRLYCFACGFMWSTTYLAIQGFILMSDNLHGNRFLNLFFMGLFYMVSKILMLFILNRFDRKRLMLVWLSCSTLTLLLIVLISTLKPDLSIFIIICSVVGCFFMSNCTSVLWIFTNELYPTKLRTIGLGSAMSAGSVTSLAAPFMGYVVERVNWLPGTVFAAMCLIYMGLLVFLPETRGKGFTQTMNDVEHLDHGSNSVELQSHTST